MKKILTLLLTSLFFFGYAQRDFIVADPTNDLTPFTDGEILQYAVTPEELEANWGEKKIIFTLINITSARFEMQTLRTDVAIVEGVNPYVCVFGSCFDSTVVALGGVIEAGAGEEYEFHFNPNGKTGFNKFRFEFWTKEDKTDIFTLHVEITILPVSVKERKSEAKLSAYPNPAPANSTITVSYSVNNTGNNLVIRNILGATVMSMPLSPYENTISIDAANLNAGIYFYAVENRNQIMVAKKLIVRN